MAEFFFNYGLFAAKLLTIVIAIMAVIFISIITGMRVRKTKKGHIEVTKVNDEIDFMRNALNARVVDLGCGTGKDVAYLRAKGIHAGCGGLDGTVHVYASCDTPTS